MNIEIPEHYITQQLFICCSILNGGFSAAALMISLGGVFGKLNPFQVLMMSLIEAGMFVLSCYIGYELLHVIDVGMNKIDLFLEDLKD